MYLKNLQRMDEVRVKVRNLKNITYKFINSMFYVSGLVVLHVMWEANQKWLLKESDSQHLICGWESLKRCSSYDWSHTRCASSIDPLWSYVLVGINDIFQLTADPFLLLIGASILLYWNKKKIDKTRTGSLSGKIPSSKLLPSKEDFYHLWPIPCDISQRYHDFKFFNWMLRGVK